MSNKQKKKYLLKNLSLSFSFEWEALISSHLHWFWYSISLRCLQLSPFFFILFQQVLQTSWEKGWAHIYDCATEGRFSLHVKSDHAFSFESVFTVRQKGKLLSNFWLLIIPSFVSHSILSSPRALSRTLFW